MKDDRLTLDILYRRKKRLGEAISSAATLVAAVEFSKKRQEKIDAQMLKRGEKIREIDAEIERIENSYLPEDLR